jgi:phage terminase large subunit-like protein
MSVDFNFNDLIDMLDGEEFDERPVDLRTFVTDPQFLALPPLSEAQYTLIEKSSQIYKEATLKKLFGDEEGARMYKQTATEVIAQLGKGSGKDYSSTIAVSYIVYLLLCLKDPATYYGKPPGDAIDILNIAINAQQANNVFFKGFKTRIERSPWFVGKYTDKASEMKFDKSVTVHSGHSEREAWEGYNVLVVILDEISGFATDNTTGHDQAKTANAIYDMYRASVDSRFPDFGKVILLSFPRFKNDPIQKFYDSVIAEKETIIRTHHFKMDEDLPDGTEGNEFEVQWEEDHIKSYLIPKVYALKRPTWEVNPTRSIDDFKTAFYKNSLDALGRFACMPPEMVDAFFKSREKIEKAFNKMNLAVDNFGRIEEWFKPENDKDYFIHVDLAQKHDHCAVALAHVDRWVNVKVTNEYSQPAPIVSVDAVRYWTPTPDKSVDFTEVKDYILSLKTRGFNIRACTFDRWNSHDMMQQLKSYGINTELLSVAKKHYDDMAMVVMEERLSGPAIKLLIDELLQLKIMRDRVDHPRKGSKDLADAVCGAVYNSISRTRPNMDNEIKIHTYESMSFDNDFNPREEKDESYNLIRAPRMPENLQEAMDRMQIL